MAFSICPPVEYVECEIKNRRVFVVEDIELPSIEEEF